ncbi:MAG: hypothetical protein LBT74_11515 [Acidobacteriota bacterium]|nr:hypothetical protein [Acidobacteriota bacterium]
MRRELGIEPVDEAWVVTVPAQRDLDKLQAWAGRWGMRLRILVCRGVEEFASQGEIRTMRSFIYRVVLKARSATTGKVYLSLTGGRKTMSADMQEAGNLFGCDAMLHIVDLRQPPEIREQIKNDDFLDEPGRWASYYMPVSVNTRIERSMVVAAGERPLCDTDFPLSWSGDGLYGEYDEDCKLAEEIARRKEQSSQLYANFYQQLSDDSGNGGQSVFRKLYFLHPDILNALRNTPPSPEAMRELPKADLHTHFGGVLDARGILAVSRAAGSSDDTEAKKLVSRRDLAGLRRLRENIFADKQKDFAAFHRRLIAFVNAFGTCEACEARTGSVEDEGAAALLDELIFGDYTDPCKYRGVGIDPYQALGDFQGSSLLQTREALEAAVHGYARKLASDNVRYVEIRCSPYKYTRLGLRVEEVVDTILDALDAHAEDFEYRLIAIIGRQASPVELYQSVADILRLVDDSRFSGKLVGIDLAGNEGAKTPAELRGIFMPFLEKCMHVTIHAGETEQADNIWQAVYHLSADRIGHGLKLIDHPDLMRRFVDRNIGIEMCPCSNDQIVGFAGGEYPLKRYLEAGLKVSVNTDNAGISRTMLSGEFVKADKLCNGLSLWDCLVLIRNSLVTSFADIDTRKKCLRRFEDDIYDWCMKNRKRLSV